MTARKIAFWIVASVLISFAGWAFGVEMMNLGGNIIKGSVHDDFIWRTGLVIGVFGKVIRGIGLTFGPFYLVRNFSKLPSEQKVPTHNPFYL